MRDSFMSDVNLLSESVALERPAPHVALVTIQRPEARNAVNVAVAHGISRAVDISESDVDTWVVIITGAGGKSFCAGADLKEVAAGRAMMLRTAEGGFAGFTHRTRQKPWIAAVDGFAVGGGCEIALACDMIVASETSVFGLPEPKRGLIAGAGGVYRLPRALPRHIALELIATGGELPASRAYAFGMVNRLTPPGKPVETAIDLARRVCDCAPVAVYESLKVARVAADFDDATLKQMTDSGRDRNSQTADYNEGPRAFLEKRAPKWIGR
jgi:enoyl-CoA hydratase/carnithine racemase